MRNYRGAEEIINDGPVRDESKLILFFAEEGGSNLLVNTTHVSPSRRHQKLSTLRPTPRPRALSKPSWRYITRCCAPCSVSLFLHSVNIRPQFSRESLGGAWLTIFVTKFLRYFTSSANRQDTSVAGRDDGEVGQVVSRSVFIDTASACADSVQLGSKLSTCLLHRDRPEDIGERQFCEQDGP